MSRLNNTMTADDQPKLSTVPESRPNETSGLNIDEFVRIYDPENKEVILEKRA